MGEQYLKSLFAPPRARSADAPRRSRGWSPRREDRLTDQALVGAIDVHEHRSVPHRRNAQESRIAGALRTGKYFSRTVPVRAHQTFSWRCGRDGTRGRRERRMSMLNVADRTELPQKCLQSLAADRAPSEAQMAYSAPISFRNCSTTD